VDVLFGIRDQKRENQQRHYEKHQQDFPVVVEFAHRFHYEESDQNGKAEIRNLDHDTRPPEV